MTPFFDASYASDSADGFVDSGRRNVPGQSVSLGSLSVGVDFDIPVPTERGGMALKPGFSLVMSDAEGDGHSGSARGSSARGRVDLGVDFNPSDGSKLRFQGYYDGIGGSGHESYGATVGVDFRF